MYNIGSPTHLVRQRKKNVKWFWSLNAAKKFAESISGSLFGETYTEIIDVTTGEIITLNN